MIYIRDPWKLPIPTVAGRLLGEEIAKVVSRASEAGSPTHRLGSAQQRDTDQGPFSLSTGELDLTRGVGKILRYGLHTDRPLLKNLKIRANIRLVL